MKQVPLLASLICFGLPVSAAEQEPAPKKLVTHQVPYRLTDTLHLMVRAKINGKGPFNFILDTGAPALFVATDVAKQLGISGDKNNWGVLDRFEIEGGIVIPNAKARIETPFQLEGMNGIGLAGATLHGIIGYTVLARYRMEIDFTRDKLAWTELDFDPPPPVGLGGKGGAMGGLDALGGIMKFLGGMMGAKAEPTIKYRGFLGAELADSNEGIEVQNVLVDGPAERAGLKRGDVIMEFQGKAVNNGAALYRGAISVPPGQKVRIVVNRNGNRHELSTELGEGL